MSFGTAEEAADHARPSFFDACQNPRTSALIPEGIVRLTYKTA